MIKKNIQTYFEQLATQWAYWQKKNNFYQQQVNSHIRGMIPPGLNVLAIGSGNGDFLASLKTKKAFGLNLAQALTELAQKSHPELQFLTMDLDSVSVPDGFKPDIVILRDMLDYVYDLSDFLKSIKKLISSETLVIITTTNPLWSPLLRLASKMRLRIPDSSRNFITNKDIRNILQLDGFDVVEEGLLLPVPKRVPILGTLLNILLPELPLFCFLSSVQSITARLSMSRAPLSCSVIIPCHNEEANIAECMRRIPNMGSRTEILIVDDGSTDQTRSIAFKALQTDKRLRLIAFDKNQGKAHAVRAGFEAATGDAVIILDADMTVPPEDLPKFFEPIQSGHADFVNGTRLIYPMEGQAMKIMNFLGNKFYCYLASWILRQRVSDTLCGTKALLKNDYQRMIISEKERWGDFNLLFGAARLKLRMAEVPIHYQERRTGFSKMRIFYDGWLFLIACLAGWRLLRFPERFPWPATRHSISGWNEIK